MYQKRARFENCHLVLFYVTFTVGTASYNTVNGLYYQNHYFFVNDFCQKSENTTYSRYGLQFRPLICFVQGVLNKNLSIGWLLFQPRFTFNTSREFLPDQLPTIDATDNPSSTERVATQDTVMTSSTSTNISQMTTAAMVGSTSTIPSIIDTASSSTAMMGSSTLSTETPSVAETTAASTASPDINTTDTSTIPISTVSTVSEVSANVASTETMATVPGSTVESTAAPQVTTSGTATISPTMESSTTAMTMLPGMVTVMTESTVSTTSATTDSTTPVMAVVTESTVPVTSTATVDPATQTTTSSITRAAFTSSTIPSDNIDGQTGAEGNFEGTSTDPPPSAVPIRFV